MVRLSETGKIITGNTPKTSDQKNYASNDIPFVKPSDISECDVSFIKLTEYWISEYAREKARILPPNSILVTCIGIIGKVAIAERECAFNQQINAIIPNEKYLPEYLAYAILAKQIYLQKIANAPVVPIINKSQFGDIEIQGSELHTQRIVVDKLNTIRNLIHARYTQLKKLDELIKSRFVEMFGDINEYCDVGYYIKALIAGKSLAGEEECENKVLKTGAASYDFFDASQVKNLPLDYVPHHEHLVNVGDIIISRMNTAELTGAAAYVWNVPEKVYLPDRLWKAILQDNCNPIFLWQILILPSTKEQIRRECSGTSGSMKNISKLGMLAIKVKKVSIKMQNQFADFVTQVEKQKATVQQSIDKLETLKKSLMQEYFG